jgi:hypothetical protein
VAEAVQQARSSLDGEKPTFGFLFASPDRALVDLLAAARESTGAEIVGCTSAGEITERGLTHGGIALMLVAADATIDVRFATGLNADPADVARELCNELGIHFFERIGRARAPLRVGPRGSLVCAAEIPKGSMVSILDGDPDRMILAARAAAAAARASVKGPVAGVLLFDCVCRGMILKDAFRREVEVVRSEFPDAPVAGLLTYGEIARSHERVDGWHNATAVVVAIPA